SYKALSAVLINASIDNLSERMTV
ncbi:MAG: hypothetical protein K0R09_2326, partial [Clostridiales bacterium]|nr:hypothetical protein [Clostridiales bacterium]